MDAKTKQDARGAVGEATDPYRLFTTLERTWAGLPGAVLTFPVRLYLSGELAVAREGTIALSPEEKKAMLLDYRTRILADVLEAEPGGFPDFPTDVPTEGGKGKSTALRDRAYAFFSRTDAQGRRVFALLVEDVVREYWEIAIPSPTLPVSGS